MKLRTPLLLAPAFAVALSSCVVEVPPSESAPANRPPTGEVATAGVPSLRTKPNGDIEVFFGKNGCVVTFDRYGNLVEGGRTCDDMDLHRAKQAVRAHLAEQNADFNDV